MAKPDPTQSERPVDLAGNIAAVADALRKGKSVALVQCAYSAAGRIPCVYAGRLPSCRRCQVLRRQEMSDRG